MSVTDKVRIALWKEDATWLEVEMIAAAIATVVALIGLSMT